MRKKILACLIIITALFARYLPVQGIAPSQNISIHFRNNEVGIGEKLYLDFNIEGKDNISKAIGYFMSQDGRGSYKSLYLKDINTDDPFFEISSYMQSGVTYRMGALIINTENSETTYAVANDCSYTSMPCINPTGSNDITIKSPTAITDFRLLNGKDININNTINLELKTDREVNFATVLIQNKNIPSIRALLSVNPNTETALRIPTEPGIQQLTTGEYQITDVFLDPNSNTKSVHYSLYPQKYSSPTKQLDYNIEFDIVDQQDQPEEETQPKTNDNISILNEIKILKTSANLNEKVGVELITSEPITFASLTFKNENSDMVVDLKDLDTTSPYFIIPFTTAEGTYELNYATLIDKNGNKYQYHKGDNYQSIKHFDFNSTITVKNEIAEGNILTLDNSKITDTIIDKIKELNDGLIIEVNSDNNPIITKELFEAIKGANKTLTIIYGDFEWTFNSQDIKNPKQIIVNTKAVDVNKSNLSGKAKNGIIIEFPNNGELPGKCSIKVRGTYHIAKVLGQDNVNIYYYNEETGEFETVQLDTVYNNKGYYEFNISHTSSYILTKDRLDNNLEATNDNNNKTILYISIGIAIGLIILTAIVVIIIKKKKNNKTPGPETSNEANINSNNAAPTTNNNTVAKINEETNAESISHPPESF